MSEYFRPINHENMHFTLNPKTIPPNFIEVEIVFLLDSFFIKTLFIIAHPRKSL